MARASLNGAGMLAFTLPLVVGVALAAVAGVSMGMLGGGGSILTVPLLVYVVGVAPHEAIPMSLAVVGATSVAALVPYARRGAVRYRVGAIFGGASMVGAFGGAQLARLVPPTLLLIGFAAIMLVAAAAMMRSRGEPEDGEAATDARGSTLKFVAQGLFVGVLTGLLGAGGGFLIVPALTLMGRLPMREAVGTSLLIIAVNSLAGFAGHLGHLDLDVPLTLVIGAAAIAGSLVGGHLAERVAQPLLRRAFAWLVLVIATLVMGRELPLALGISPPPLALVGAMVALVLFAARDLLRRTAATP